ncbi:MAG: DUF2946 family protein [Halofilum sp. (in: g-proteobacteria)]
MDESVRRAMGKWPNVPAVYGWLSLGLDGHWHLRGEPIAHAGLVDFINRNYERDERGCWFFQNGPQRGYVMLAYTPWVLHVDDDGTLCTHTGPSVARVDAACVDEEGHLLLATEFGLGLVHAASVAAVSEWLIDESDHRTDADSFAAALNRLDAGEPGGLYLRYGGASVALERISRREAPERFGFVPEPQPPEP